MNTIKIGPNEMSYTEIGKGETIVLLHGFCGSMSYWDKVVTKLSQEYRVILVDLRGHGHSSSNVSPFTIDDMAKDIKELLESLHLGQVYLFGHSLGGYITLSLMEHFPEKLKGFGLIHSTAFPDTDEGKAGRLAGFENIEKNGIHPFIDGLVPKLFADENLDKLKEEVEKTKIIGYRTSPEAAKQTLLAMKNRPGRNAVIRNSTIPILLVAGEHDKIIPVQKVFSVEGSHIHTKVIPHAGHMSMYEQPEELYKVLWEFLERQKN
ncbi:alpha/beta fold hydrolase [Neobacillus sp. D3-1R]|uniref:alpha/beta fold hydrolase n=1 Tax=Neobacillus sp. D3-1R TaxID=3445778 RepID=UPI003F9EEEEF